MKNMYGDFVSLETELTVNAILGKIKSLMTQNNLTNVKVEYSGAGDSGEVSHVQAFSGRKKCNVPADLSPAAFGLVEALHGGYENEDGGGGIISFVLNDNTLVLKYHGYNYEVSRKDTKTTVSI